ncbi:alpha/beta fold hydrolase [Micromonospora sagamiensis]|uniref:Alpha-beta hydrolase superfamily lysophospholipase n=1 Tax=Micromonospora sagamiensis TaxID=47875 RepID=A0A562WCP2_9ACTN|nr:alpha/beta fold hydrolase [Micromonospora sagamiensis]TWJ28022.1 alpha-beta hydrolase superfamily lysophospholipase [Micromonospora sagamiensis]BCL13087.1 hypothetical protein GCM10017556_08260 [Micromonospora sagamiensis]
MGIITEDRTVAHRSTVPANRDTDVNLFVRWLRRNDVDSLPAARRRPVLMLHGRSVPGLVWADLDSNFGSYSWARELANDGFDVFVMDLQGMGRSSRPAQMDQPCNVNPAQQRLIGVSCAPTYRKQLNNSQTDQDELDAVVEWIRKELRLPAGQQIALIGYSAAAYALGPYAMTYPKKVSSLLLVAPIFPLQGRSTYDPPLLEDAISAPVGLYGFPMHIEDKTFFKAGWDSQLDTVNCPDQRDDANNVVDVVWNAIMANDPRGSSWGPGVTRVRNVYWWGWNSSIVSADRTDLGTRVPLLIIYGARDTTANNPASFSGPLSVPDLYYAVQGHRKLMYRLDCAGHFVVWERQREHLYRLSKEWLNSPDHSIDGNSTGTFSVDKNGEVKPTSIDPMGVLSEPL